MLCPGFALKRAEVTFPPDPIKVWTVLLGLKGAAFEEASGFRHCPERPGSRGVSSVLGLGPEHPALHVAGGLRPARGEARGWPRCSLACLHPQAQGNCGYTEAAGPSLAPPPGRTSASVLRGGPPALVGVG